MDIIDQQEIHDEERSLESVLTEGYTFSIGDTLNKGFKLFGADAGPYIGFFLVSFLISAAVGMIPIVSFVGGLLISPALNAGYYLYRRSIDKNGVASFNNFFDGFKNPAWGQLVLANLIISIFIGILVAVMAIPLFLTLGVGFLAELSSIGPTSDPEDIQALIAAILGGSFFLLFLGILVVVALVAALWILTPLFIINKGLSFWDAMEASRKVVSKNYLKFFLLMIVIGFLAMLGALICLVGLLVAIPVIYLCIYSAYKHIFSPNSGHSFGNRSQDFIYGFRSKAARDQILI